MGLDTVELLMSFEDEFGIAIKEDDAEKMGTPADVADYVMLRVRTNTGAPCPSQVGFYRIRSMLMTAFGIPRKDIHPNALLSEILKGDTKQQWRKLQDALDAKNFPKLKRSRAFFYLVVFGVPAIIVIPMLKTAAPVSWAALAYGILALCTNALTTGMGTIIPGRYQTVGTLIPYVTCASSILWTREAVLAKVIQITSEQLDIPVNKIYPNSHFVHDLDAD